MQHKIRKTYFKTQFNYVYFNYFTTLNVGAPTSWSEERNRPQNLPELMSRIWSTADCPDKHDMSTRRRRRFEISVSPWKLHLLPSWHMLLSGRHSCNGKYFYWVWSFYATERMCLNGSDKTVACTEAQIRSMAHHRSLLLTVYVYVGYKCHLSATNVAKCEQAVITATIWTLFHFDSTAIRRPFDCLSKVIKVTLT